MSITQTCHRCGLPLGRFFRGSVCAHCLLAAGLSDMGENDFTVRTETAEFLAPKPGGALGRFGNYELLEEIARGGMGVVYRARDLTVNRIVALKMILAGQFATERDLTRFRAETEAAARLDHPHIVPLYEVGERDGWPFFSMKLMEGGALTARLKDGKPMEGRKAAVLMVKVARAVHHAHERGVLHRDLKPGNILLDAAGEPYVSDFGLAKSLDGTSGVTLTGSTLGSPSYMPPEQVSGDSDRLTCAADTYGAGAVLYHLLTGQPPFLAETPLATLEQVLHLSPKAPTAIQPGIDRDLETICLKCLEKSPGHRYESADALARDMERWLNHEPISARPASRAERFVKWVRRNPKIAILLALLNAVCILGAVGILIGSLRLASANRAKDGANAQLARHLRNLEWQKIDDLIAAGKRGDALAYLSHFLRQNPSDQVAATRVISMLGACNFALPALPALHHAAPVNVLEASGDLLLTASDDREVRIWTRADGREVGRLLHHAGVKMASFFDRNRLILTTDQEGVSRVWDWAEAKLVFQFPKGASARGVVMSPDRTQMLQWESDVSMQLWDLTSFQPVGAPFRFGAAVRSAVFNSSGRLFAIGAADGSVIVFEMNSLDQPKHSFKLQGDETALEFSPDSALLAVAWADHVTLWDLRTGRQAREFKAHDGHVLAIRFTPGGDRLVTTAYDRAPRIWDLETGQTVGQPIEAERPFIFFEISADGKRLATRSQSGVARVWDAFTGLPLSEPFEHHGPITSLRFTEDGRSILTASQDGSAQIWEIQSPLPSELTLPTTDHSPAASFSPDGRLVYWASNRQVEIFDRESGQKRGRPMPHAGEIYRIELSPDGRKLATASWDNTGRIWDALTGEPLTPPLQHRWRLYSIAFSPDGRLVATGASDETVRIWDADTGNPVGTELSHSSEVMHVRFRPDSRALLTASADTTAGLWSVETGQLLWPAPARHRGIVWTAEFSPDGTKVVTASSDRSAIIRDARSGEAVAPPLVHDRGVFAAQFSPMGNWVLTCSEDGTARVWDARSGRPVSQPMRHKDKLAHGAFSPDQRLVFTGSHGGDARLWDAGSGYSITDPLQHKGSITAVQFSADGRSCLSIANADALRVWEVIVAPVPVPAWFCGFIEAVSGKRINLRGDVEAVGRDLLHELRKELGMIAEQDYYTDWVRWFVIQRVEPLSKPL